MNNSTAERAKITTFCCNWSVHPGLKLSNFPTEEENKSIVTMCTGRVGLELVLQAFEYGAWGVLICACSLGECKHDGNYKTLRRVLLLKMVLSQFNIEPERVRIEWIDTGEITKICDAMNGFYDEMLKLGPIKLGR
ncbi:hydrogenase iron-sulfur subunit [candidate division WOR-3 bacterium]|nr:hydrogenase iron-sulfur subunit [candidate division WOR-3 bacterium]